MKQDIVAIVTEAIETDIVQVQHAVLLVVHMGKLLVLVALPVLMAGIIKDHLHTVTTSSVVRLAPADIQNITVE